MTSKKKDQADEQPAVLAFNVDEFTIGDLEDFEDATGMNLIGIIRKMQGDGAELPHPRALRGMLWLMRRKADPTVTFESLRDLSLSEMSAGLQVAEADTPPSS